MDNLELYNKVKKRYLNIFKDENEFNHFYKLCITDENKNDNSLFIENFYSVIHNYIKENGFNSVITNYAAKTLTMVDSVDNAINELNKIKNLLQTIKYPLNFDTYYNIIINNKIVESLLEIIVNSNIQIKNKFIENLLIFYRDNNLNEHDSNYTQNYELLKKYKNGDFEARNKLINNNIFLVKSRACRFVQGKFDFDDLVEEGTLGLIKAIDKFDINTNYSFSTYAVYWIDSSIRKYCKSNAYGYKVPIYIINLKNKISLLKSQYEKLGKTITDQEIADILGIPYEKVLEISYKINDTLSLNEHITQDNDEISELIDMIPSKTTTEEEALKNLELYDLQLIFEKANLTEQEKDIIKCRVYNDGRNVLSLETIGEKYNLSKQRINQKEKNAYNKIGRVLKREEQKYKVNTSENKLKYLNISIYEYFSDYKKDYVDIALNSLNTEEQELLKLKFGEYYSIVILDSCIDSENLVKIRNIIDKMKKVINNICNPTKNLFYYFPNDTKEDVLYAVSKMNIENISLLKKKHGEDYSENKSVKLTKKENDQIYYLRKTIIPKLILKKKNGDENNSKGTKLIEKYNNCTLEQLLMVTNLLDINDQELLNKTYGSNYNEVHLDILTQNEKKRLNYLTTDKIPRLLKLYYRNNIKKVNYDIKSNLKNLFILLNNIDCNELIKYCEQEELLIISLYLVQNKFHSIDDIINFLNISKIDIINVINNILIKCDKINKKDIQKKLIQPK